MLAMEYRFVHWPEAPLDAAKYFHDEIVPEVRGVIAGTGRYAEIAAMEASPATLDGVVLVLPVAGHEHYGWRLAAIQELAREAAPKRVNGVVGDDQDAINEAVAYLMSAQGITGQLLVVDGKSAAKD